MKVWLSKREVEELLDQFGDNSKRIAASLAARCGLRSEEVLDVALENVVETDAGQMLRVWECAKTGKYRETPISPNFPKTIAPLVTFMLRSSSTSRQTRFDASRRRSSTPPASKT